MRHLHCLVTLFGLLLSYSSLAQIRISMGPQVQLERSQEQVTEGRMALSYQVGYHLSDVPLLLEFQMRDDEVIRTSSGSLQTETDREAYMLWAKLFSASLDAMELRTFAALGVGGARYKIRARVNEDSIKVKSKIEWEWGIAVGAEWRPKMSLFFFDGQLGYNIGEVHSPNASLFVALNAGLQF